MDSSRRRFLGVAGGFAGACVFVDTLRVAQAMEMPMAMPMKQRMAMPALAAPNVPLVNPVTMAKFVDALPVPPIAVPTGKRTHAAFGSRELPFYRMPMQAFSARVHRDLPPTPQWGYAGSTPGPTIVTRRGEPVLVEWANELPTRHFLPIDHGVHGAEKSKPEVRTITHVHGARVSAPNDGWPEDWYVPGKSLTALYPGDQDATTLWYHDHAMGITRLNIYAGLFGSFHVHDDDEQALGLPSGEFDIPLMLYDRLLAKSGKLYYPVSDDPEAPWVSECRGDAVLCNGKLYPYLDVEPRRYRFRLINAANTSFFNLSLSHGKPFQQIGSDQGLLIAPTDRMNIELYPAERAEVVVDFSAYAGKSVQLRHQADGIVEFRVRAKGRNDSSVVPATLRPIKRIELSTAVQDRVLALGEQDDSGGNPMTMLLDGKMWSDPISEKPKKGTVETWTFVNVTGDAHPIHLHLVRFQVLERRPFDLYAWNARKELKFTGPSIPPAAHEAGWKDTVRCDPGMVTRIITRFDGEPGKYVWHCHYLEHEDNEMMRPYELV
ncbi:multicopper oxidase family protein [Luteibacter aegosomatissinici]|uniref:multicopper oxidase family protein n=1 Tax=Luteibacter aegosomatissinici TaxID=2911539 RepID=UPI001FF83F17|nr:multicopper oxidase domain-containing protein [Luteibacter aegosomatissinici]UPG94748.1 multicopper oxidase domain-containing protein [Luteibacter aegosomatissinici]